MSEEASDIPIPGRILVCDYPYLPFAKLRRGRQTTVDGPLRLPAIVFGTATFWNQYNTDEHLASSFPVRTVGLALRYGIRAFDTSVFYGESELVLGNALQALKGEFPRSSYQLMTKCGRYGRHDFDYSPSRVQESVKQSLARLQTDYLDTVYLHDVEFVATRVAPRSSGNHLAAIFEEKGLYGLGEGDEGRIRGEGDQKILDAFAELRRLQEEGLVKKIGITGYPLPVLLRLALLILHTPPYKPVDVLLSYSHLTLQNGTFTEYARELLQRAQVGQLVAASPLSMGLLTPSPPPWHPAPAELKAAARRADAIWPGGLPNLALGYAFRNTGASYGNVPLVAGFSRPEEVHECIKAWREQQGEVDSSRRGAEESVREVFRDAGYLDWSWASP